MSNPDGVLAAIDACLDDYAVSDEAMRWAPDEPDPTPESVPFGEQIARFAEQNTGFTVMDWQRHYLNALTPAIEAAAQEPAYAPGSVVRPGGALRWATTLSPAREVFVTAGEYTLALERAATALSEFAGEVQSAAQSALGAFGKAFAPFITTTQAALHRAAHRDDRKHIRRCPTCNPRGFPKPLPINGHEYHRRQSRRNRR